MLAQLCDRPTTRVATLSAILLVLTAFGVAITTTSPAYACNPGEDVNILCSNEQAFVDGLATVGVTPTQTPKILVNLGWQVCGQLYRGTGYDLVVQNVYRENPVHIDQAHAIVSTAIRTLCPAARDYV